MLAFEALCQSKMLKFEYRNIFFNFCFYEDTTFQYRQNEHVMVYVYSGFIKVQDTSSQITEVGCEQCLFIKKNTSVLISCHPDDESEFSCLFLAIKQESLNSLSYLKYSVLYSSHITQCLPKIMQLPKTADIKSLFISMIPYFNWPQNPCKKIMSLKQMEAIYSLIYAGRKL